MPTKMQRIAVVTGGGSGILRLPPGRKACLFRGQDTRILEKQNRLQMSQVFPFRASMIKWALSLSFTGFPSCAKYPFENFRHTGIGIVLRVNFKPTEVGGTGNMS